MRTREGRKLKKDLTFKVTSDIIHILLSHLRLSKLLYKVYIMTRLQLLEKVKQRRKDIDITIDNLSQVANLGLRTVTRFFAGDDVKLSTVEKVTDVLGLDFAGNEIIDIKTLQNKRAEQKALYIVSLVQDTSSLEMQGLEKKELNQLLIETKQQFLTGEYQNTLWAS